MTITEVTDRNTGRMFLDTARLIYKNDKTWVCPLDKEIEAVFTPGKNPYFRHGEAARWIMTDERGILCGRIAAFIDNNLSMSWEQPTGGIGFFECINDRDSAALLFDTAREWLRSRGMEAMDGPVNFGETDKYWGLLVDGFTHPAFEIAYNPPYYKDLFESYGFLTFYNMEGFHLDLKKPLPDRFMKIAERITNKPGYEFRHFNWKEEKKFSHDFAQVFNEAWASFKKNFEPLEEEYIRQTLKKAKPIVEEEFIWLAYFEGNPVAIYLMFPDMNQILRHLNGKMNLFSMLKFLWLREHKTMTRARGMLMGVIPKFQGLGIESGFIFHLLKTFEKKPHYNEIEFSFVADFNPRMRKIWVAVGALPAKNYKTYRYLFDRSKEFKRYPIPV